MSSAAEEDLNRASMNFSEEGEILGNETCLLLLWIFNVRKVSHPEIIATFSDDIRIWGHMSERAAKVVVS